MLKKALKMVALAVALTSGGCLQKETTHTLYLAPDGGVRWMAIERDVHSDEKDPTARRSEEDAYIAAASTGTHAIGEGLAALDPSSQRTRILRSQRPFVVVTESQFGGVRDLFERVLAELRVPGQVTLTRASGETTLRVQVEVAGAAIDDAEPASPVAALCEELAVFRIVLTSGRFVAAEGFKLSEDRTTARFDEDLVAQGETVDVALTWSDH